jgi:hypothetical protein
MKKLLLTVILAQSLFCFGLNSSAYKLPQNSDPSPIKDFLLSNWQNGEDPVQYLNDKLKEYVAVLSNLSLTECLVYLLSEEN